MTTIHPTALVHPDARLGAEVAIGPYAVIEEKVTLGDGVTVGPHAVIMAYTTVGARTAIHAHAVIGDTPQDVAFKNEPSYVVIGANCLVREGVTIHRGTKPGTTTTMGDGCFLMVNSHLGHNVTLGRGVIIANGALLGGYAEVGERAFISGNVLIHQFCRVGRLAMLSGGSGISKDVPPFCMTHGAAGNRISGLNTIGLRRAGIGAEDRLALRKAFHGVFLAGLNTREAVARVRQDTDSAIVREFCEFIETAKRGICRATGAGEGEDEAPL